MTNLGRTVWIKEWLELGKGGMTLILRQVFSISSILLWSM
jgi:hypothetical protein